VQRNVTGHYPVDVKTSSGDPSFALVLEGDNGTLYRKTYVFNGYRVNLVNTEAVPGAWLRECRSHGCGGAGPGGGGRVGRGTRESRKRSLSFLAGNS